MKDLIYIQKAILPMKKTLLYLDPGSGSFILQIILAALLGWLLVIRSHWKKIKDWIRNLFTREK